MSNYTNEQAQEAHRILEQCPFSLKHFLPWMKFLTEGRNAYKGATTFERTLEFVRTHKLPKAKTLKWLADNAISNDFEIVMKIFMPTTNMIAKAIEENASKNAVPTSFQ